MWSLNLKQEGTNTISTGCFNVTFSGINDINLQGAYPISDEEGASLTPYEFTITNTCEDAATYQVNLEILNDSTLTELGIIKELLQEKGSTGTPKLLTSNNIVDKTLDNASSSYKLETGLLYKNESKTFELRLWMDEDTTVKDSVMNKVFNSKVTVITSYTTPIETNMMVPMEIVIDDEDVFYLSDIKNLTYTKNRTYNIHKVIFESSLNPHENAIDIVDLSVLHDRSVLGYYVLYDVTDENSERYNLYIQANGKIKANPNASYYFSGASYISGFEGIENVDTSYVEDMSYIFSYRSDLKSLDLSVFNTSNVKKMRNLFVQCVYCPHNELTSLDLSSWDTSNVTDMRGMFSKNSQLTDLNINGFDTRNVTDMSWMFFDTSLTSLDLNDFDTSNVTDMSHMFSDMGKLTNLDLSKFDTRKVTNMNFMFNYDDSLNTVTYGPKFVYKNSANVEDMFNGCPANKPTDSSWEGVFS